jgi:glucose-6-phosphate isomerase, archaeal
MNKIINPSVKVDLSSGKLAGEGVVEIKRTLEDLKGVFEDYEAYTNLDKSTIMYRVESHLKEKEGKEGGLFFGTSYIYPGTVGDEYFMTKGHFHGKYDTAEYYWCISGEGMLILMDENRNCWAERMTSGSLHYIPGRVAHRLANTGDNILAVGACWPADAGHDYDTIAEKGFSARLKSVNGVPTLVSI